MRYVFSNAREVMHLWASKSQPEARCYNVFYFERDSDHIWSYGRHFCLGRHLPDGYVAIALDGSSSTTERHKSWLRYATGHLKQIEVYSPDAEPKASRDETTKEILRLLKLASRARQRQSSYLAQALKVQVDFNKFAELLGDATRINLWQQDSRVTPAAIEKLLADEAKRVAKAEKLAAQAAARLQRAEIAEWRAGGNPRLAYNLAPMLRLSADRQAVETSQHAHIPVEHAKRLWPVILKVKAGGFDEPFERPLGAYRLSQIRADGSIVVGCHDIAFAEIERIAQELGLLDAPQTLGSPA